MVQDLETAMKVCNRRLKYVLAIGDRGKCDGLYFFTGHKERTREDGRDWTGRVSADVGVCHVSEGARDACATCTDATVRDVRRAVHGGGHGRL